jgi:L-ascorbate metabolism protein UlaG (beta-lactamase superfamily)
MIGTKQANRLPTIRGVFTLINGGNPMSVSPVKITYLFHSGFTVETKHHFLIFDYYHPFAKPNPGTLTEAILKTKPATYVLASHHHSDHFDRTILQWANLETVTYIFSNDIRLSPPPLRSHGLTPYQELTLPGLTVKTFGSTDAGVSFLVKTDGLTIFHAGDLNCWRWKEDSAKEQQRAVDAFQAEVAKIAGNAIDIAFFPVDRRLEAYFAVGALYFAAQLQPKLLIPMHFGKDYDATVNFATLAQNLPSRTIVINRQGQEILWK